MRKFVGSMVIFGIGAGGYSGIEVMWRGYTHWTMALTGGVCFLILYRLEECFSDEPIWKRCLAGCLSITLTEFAVGFVVNILLCWDVWDYSDMMFNLYGQICPLYVLLWYGLCLPTEWLCEQILKLRNRTHSV